MTTTQFQLDSKFHVMNIYNRLCLTSLQWYVGEIPGEFHVYALQTQKRNNQTVMELIKWKPGNDLAEDTKTYAMVLSLHEFPDHLTISDDALIAEPDGACTMNEFLIHYGCMASISFPCSMTLRIGFCDKVISIVKKDLKWTDLTSQIGTMFATSLLTQEGVPTNTDIEVNAVMPTVQMKFPGEETFYNTGLSVEELNQWLAKKENYCKIGKFFICTLKIQDHPL